MSTLLIQNARCVATFDHADPSQARELRDASVFIRDHRIAFIGPTANLPSDALAADEVMTPARRCCWRA